MKKICFALLAVLSFAIHAGAQKVNGTVKGILQDSLCAAPLADATMSLVRAQDSSLVSFTVTSHTGNFEIKNIEAGSYILIRSFQVLQTRNIRVVISAQKTLDDLGTI